MGIIGPVTTTLGDLPDNIAALRAAQVAAHAKLFAEITREARIESELAVAEDVVAFTRKTFRTARKQRV
jgi:hypothetical protein